MPSNTTFQTILNKYRKYAPLFKNVWLWRDFPAKKDFGCKDTGIYLLPLLIIVITGHYNVNANKNVQ